MTHFFSSLILFQFLFCLSYGTGTVEDPDIEFGTNRILNLDNIYTQEEKDNFPSHLIDSNHNRRAINTERSADSTSDVSESELSQNGTSHSANSINSILLGKQTIGFSSNFLEAYTKKSALFWNICNAILDDLEAFGHVAATCLILFAKTETTISPSTFITLSIQVGLIAHALSKLNNFAGKVVEARNKRVQECTKMNALQKIANEEAKTNPPALREATPEEIEFLQSNYSTPFLQGFFKRLTVARIVMWDIFGVSSILFQSAAYSLANWSTYDSDNRHLFLTSAAICGVLGNFCELYLKKIKKNTETSESDAIKSKKYNSIIRNTKNMYNQHLIQAQKDDEGNQMASNV
ncbi:MAG: hypothetical protein C0432_05270 [Candidatus Puniceispirillum sp.]|nr:hypothetical protein [Candidatus Pelagibacter sp.]MBA4283685.1 hypothetical protein [Candidatus Puniceispirillum sp.]